MTFHDWIFSIYPPDAVINGRWGSLHIGVLVFCLALTIGISLLRNNSENTRKWVIRTIGIAIAALEISRRIINLSRGGSYELDHLVYVLIPRPWCAISCWMMMAAAFSRKKLLCNFSAMIGLLCALVFFAYPSVGFNHRVILFENFYSIATHSLLLIGSISMITLRFTDFRLNRQELLKTAGLLAGVFIYATLEILLNIEPDPLYFMPGNEVQAFLGVKYSTFLVIYIGFLMIYFSAFYIVQNHGILRRKAPQKARGGVA